MGALWLEREVRARMKEKSKRNGRKVIQLSWEGKKSWVACTEKCGQSVSATVRLSKRL